MALKLGSIGHFGIAVRDPKKSAKWWMATLNVKKRFSFPGGIVLGSEDVDIVLHKGTPRPEVIDHVSFHLLSKRALEQALKELRRKRVDLEDPGHEIGPEGEGSKNIGLWFRDPDGYRWELSVLAAPKKRLKRKR
ncbi:MAG: VOC family protein [Candidatus Eremiobacteraeota bacterium]|nr:VOC family protein [Candidatus Eremiobacteraeota bacterium]